MVLNLRNKTDNDYNDIMVIMLTLMIITYFATLLPDMYGVNALISCFY